MCRKKFRSKKRLLIIILICLVLIASTAIFLWGTKTGRNIFQAEVSQPLNIPERSVRLHNYNNWHFVSSAEHQDPVALEKNLLLTAQRDNIIMTEDWDRANLEIKIPDRWSGVTPNSIKSLNPNAKVYRVYALMAKPVWDSDFPRITGKVSSSTATTMNDVNSNWVDKEAFESQWTGNYVWIRSGNAEGQIKKIKSYAYDDVSGSTLEIYDQWTPPEVGSDYVFIDTSDPIDGNDAWDFMGIPLTWSQIENNDWWLLDGDGREMNENDDPDRSRYLDVGVPGAPGFKDFKEAFAENLLQRMQDDRLKSVIPNYGNFDGIVFDYWWPEISTLFVNRKDINGNPLPDLKFPARYAPLGTETVAEVDQNWFDNAWMPFVEYVMTAVRAAGYEVIGNCAGEYHPELIGQPLTNWGTRVQWQRQFVDGTVYEQGSVGWSGEWLSGQRIFDRIKSIATDPLETWVADYGVRDSWPEYERKKNVSLAMYYTVVPADQSHHSYDHEKDGLPFIDPLWNFNIGVPSEDRNQIEVDGVKKYAWSRKFSDGIVLLNYGEKADSQEIINFALDKNYVDLAGNKYSKNIDLPSHTALILKTYQTRAVSPSLPALSPVPSKPISKPKFSPTTSSIGSPSPTPIPLPIETPLSEPAPDTYYNPTPAETTETSPPVIAQITPNYSPTPTPSSSSFVPATVTPSEEPETKTKGSKISATVWVIIVIIAVPLFVYLYFWFRKKSKYLKDMGIS